MKVLIMGITGFAGSHMYNLLNSIKKVKIYGAFKDSTKNRNIKNEFNNAILKEFDINNIYSVEKLLEEIHPDIIFHFASYVSVHRSFLDPLSTFQTNIMGTAYLLEISKNIIPNAKILMPGSAEEYGKVLQNKMPIKEEYPLLPLSPYAISKKVQEEIGMYYLNKYNLNIYFTRTFHYTGPRQPQGFVCSDFAKQIIDYEKGKINSIKVGNLEAKRDFTDIRDVVSAYWMIIEKGEIGNIYNVCNGKSIAIQEILNKLIILSGKDIKIEISNDKLRPSDVPDFIGDNKKLKKLGWKPRFSINESLKDLLEGWRNEIV